MDDNKILKIVYTFFLGLILALFVGLGVSTFYPGPTPPEYPMSTLSEGKDITPSEREQQIRYEKDYRAYEEVAAGYNRNVVIITLAAAILLLAASLMLEKSSPVLANGVLLGGLFTLVYSIGRGFVTDDSRFAFAAVTVGLIVSMFLGYRRFMRPAAAYKKAARPKKKR